MNIIDAIGDPNLYGPWFPGASWNPWKIVLKAIFAIPMTDAEQKLFRTIADRDPPSEPVKEVWIVAGRRAGKDSVASVLVAHLAAMFDRGERLRPGERAVVLCLATDRDQAKIIFGYTQSYFQDIPLLAGLVQRETASGLELRSKELSETNETISPAAEAWLSGNMEKAADLNKAIPDDGPAAAPLSGAVPAYLENHLAVQNLEQKQNAAPDPAQAEGAMITRAATTLSELGREGASLVEEWGGASSPDFKENLSYAKAAFADIAKNRPDLIAKVDASGLGNDPAILKILSELGRQKAHTYGDNTVSSRRSSYDEPSRPLPSGNSAAQRELNRIFEDTPPGTPGYAKRSVQDRIRQLSEMIHGDGPAVGMQGRTA